MSPDLRPQTGLPNNYPNRVRLFADLLLADDPLFDDSLVSAGRTIERQWVYMLPVYDQVKVALQIKWSSSFSIETSSVSILDIDSDGRFSGTVNVSSVPSCCNHLGPGAEQQPAVSTVASEWRRTGQSNHQSQALAARTI